VRLGILGPAGGNLHALARAAQTLVDVHRADRVIYLGDDDALDQVVWGWAREIVGDRPDDASLFDRAAQACARADAAHIRHFVELELARGRLRIFSSLPAGPGRTIELLDGRVVLLVYDKASLDEEDIIGASILVFGRSPDYLIKKVGVRTFIAPGFIEGSGGLATFDDQDGGVRVEIFDLEGTLLASDQIGAMSPSAKVRVQGG
jgi:hypothetical protein